MPTISELQTRLSEAETALHRLLTGTQVVQVRDASGRQVSYSASNLKDLRAYIADLKRQLDQPQGYRAARVLF